MTWLKTLLETSRDYDLDDVPYVGDAHKHAPDSNDPFWLTYKRMTNRNRDHKKIFIVRQYGHQTTRLAQKPRAFYFYESKEPNLFAITNMKIEEKWSSDILTISWITKNGDVGMRDYGPSKIIIKGLSFDFDYANISYDSITVLINGELVPYSQDDGEDIFSLDFALTNIAKMKSVVTYRQPNEPRMSRTRIY